ncbi:MAG: Tripartite ATP-independent periplasmic transporter, DctQ component [Paenibacillaceae bacterium]|jgi:TRAP-type C4-dicarboxylate transport system permease small subunit|nr:Tripartite ATP-independent periplasmic transporter, DctQ component [Paenibacillaceae bacterium]
MKQIKRIALYLDFFFESLAKMGLLSMILIVTLQVFTRKLFNFVFFWSEEMTLLLLIWFSFMGIALGFREHLHLGIDTFTNMLPKPIDRLIDRIIQLCVLAFGIYLVYYGWDFTRLMHESSLPATGLPNSLTYVVMPVTGLMICIYSVLQLLGIDTVRHKNVEEGGSEA